MKKKIAALVAATLVVGALVGCGEAETASSSGGTNGTEEKTASEGDSVESGTSDDYLAQVKAAVESAKSTTPAEYSGPTDKAGAPPENIKVAVIPSDGTLSGCTAPCYGVMDAVENIDTWEAQYFDGGGDASSQNAAILSAISWGADIIYCSSVDPRNVQQGIEAAQSEDILICCGSNGIMDPNPVLELDDGQLNFAFDVAPNYREIGLAIGNWIVADCDNEGGVLVFGDNEFPSVDALQVGLLEALDASNVEYDEVHYFSGSEIGDTLNRQMVSYLTEHPEVKYVFSPFDPAAASMVEGLNQAGMSDIKLVSVLGISQNIEFIRSGDVQVADGAYDNTYMGWAVVDQCIRQLNGKELTSPMGENLPYCVIDATNLPAEGESFTADYDYKAQFLSLWTD